MSDLESATSGFELVLREHREFKAMSEELRDFLDRPRPGPGQPGHHRWAAELARRLAELHDKLVLHFHREERDGLFETLTRISPGAPCSTPRVPSRRTRISAGAWSSFSIA
jgi:hypothetical protein